MAKAATEREAVSCPAPSPKSSRLPPALLPGFGCRGWVYEKICRVAFFVNHLSQPLRSLRNSTSDVDQKLMRRRQLPGFFVKLCPVCNLCTTYTRRGIFRRPALLIMTSEAKVIPSQQSIDFPCTRHSPWLVTPYTLV